MPDRKGKSPFVYIYLDSEGIESLYAQTADRVEVEIVKSSSTEGRGAVGLKAGFGNFLTTLLGLKEASAETKLETIRGQIEEAKSRLSVEHKVSRLSEYLSISTNCFGDLASAAESATKPGQHVFIRIETLFDVPDFFPGGDGVDAINSSRAIVFTINPSYDPSDTYFKRPVLSIIMTAGLDKFTRLKHGMGGTSHEAIQFRGLLGKDVPLGVFGYLLRHNERVCQIKPYAIWLPLGSK
jgi:hypothetical protein